MSHYVDVVIPVHNSVHWLSWCLDELFRFDSHTLRCVYVVDDRSDPSQSYKIKEIVARHINVELIENKDEDGGFGYACNLGAMRCESDIILFLNTDCLLTEGVLDRLSLVFELEQNVALACPISNNSPDLTYPMLPGRTYRDMADLIFKATSHSENDFIVEACTVVGNCLMVRRRFFETIGGFSPEWGVGYGEETDLHMKALSLGMKGVVHVGCYVYHFGGGTFNYQLEIEEHRGRNYKLFMSKWSKEYKALMSRCSVKKTLRLLSNAIERSLLVNKSELIELDVLFYLPGIDQSIGGLNAVVAICNDLVRRGLKVSCALVGIKADRGIEDYKEPVLFNFLYFISDSDFLSDRTILPKVVFSTIFNSASIIAEYAAVRGAIAGQFVQGYEGYFENGQRYVEASESYKSTEHLVTTSTWLFDMVSRHLQPGQHIQRLPLVINSDLFFSSDQTRDIDVALVFRSGPDKGQWILAETLDRLIRNNRTLIVLCAPSYSFLKTKYSDKAQFVDLPIDQYSLARLFRRVKIYVDASLHEGYGLIPLEAALCGCGLVLSDSGGVRDFVNQYGGEIIAGGPDPKSIVDAVSRKLDGIVSVQRINYMQQQMLLGAGSSWYHYVQDMCKNQPLPAFTTVVLERDVFATMHNIYKYNCVVLYGTLIKVYRRVFSYMPVRLHMVLKVLFFGKL